MKKHLVIALLAALAAVVTIDSAEAVVECSGVPLLDRKESGEFLWHFDLENRRCRRNGRPNHGWQIATDDDDVYLFDTIGIGPSGLNTKGLDGCEVTVLEVIDENPDDDDANTDGAYDVDDGSARLPMTAKCGRTGQNGAHFLRANGHRYKIVIEFKGSADQVSYGVFVEMKAWSNEVDGVNGRHEVHALCAWGGAFGAKPGLMPGNECAETALLSATPEGTDESKIVEKLIRDFMQRRAAVVVSEEINLAERLLAPRTLQMKVSKLAIQHVNAAFAASLSGLHGDDGHVDHGWDVWTKGKFVYVDQTDDILGLGWAGIDYHFDHDLVVGVMAQSDFIETEHAGSGLGWLAGPYVVARPVEGLIVDVRVAAGLSDNRISAFGTHDQSFKTRRTLARAQITGDLEFGPATFNPFVRGVYWRERQHRYTDYAGRNIRGQTIELGQLTFGPSLDVDVELGDGWLLTPMVTASGVWDFQRTEGPEELRGRAEFVVMITTPIGVNLKAECFYDGLGQSDYTAFGGALQVAVQLN